MKASSGFKPNVDFNTEHDEHMKMESLHDHTYFQDKSENDPIIVGSFPDIGPDITPPGIDELSYTGLVTIQRAYAAGGEEEGMESEAIPDLNKASKPV